MKEYRIVQHYQSIADMRNKNKMTAPKFLGDYPAESIDKAIKAASKEHNLDAVLLKSTRVYTN